MNTSRYRVRPGEKVRLHKCPSGDTGPFKDKQGAADRLSKGVGRLVELQEKLYADNRWALLLIFQAMDAAGKDSAIKHVMSGLNPQGTQVYSFKRPSDEELDHDYLWRTTKALPQRGRIGIFNRSYYEEVLVVRVHPDVLGRQKLPAKLVTPDIWKERYQDINAYERFLTRNGTVIRKFFLHVSREEQRQRLLARLNEPSKHWKFEAADLGERKLWREYQKANEDMLTQTSTKHAPWFVVPADHKWYTRLVIAELVREALESLDLKYPEVPQAERAALARAKRELERES